MSEFEISRSIEQKIAEQQAWLIEAAQVIGGEEADTSLFSKPTEVRDDAEPIVLSNEQESRLREIASRFGVGSEVDIPSGADYDIIEGGKPWKILAEAEMTTGIKIFAGSHKRQIGNDEKQFFAERYGCDINVFDEMSELAMVDLLATGQKDFIDEPITVDMGVGYKVDEGNKTLNQPTGQLIRIGMVKDEPVYLLRVDREDYMDEEGKTKYRYQPDGARLLGFISDWLDTKGDDSSSIGLNTSNTYASRALDVTLASLRRGRDFRIGMYGRSTLRDIAGDKVPAETPINQIPGELHTIAQKIQKIELLLGINNY